nr:MAG TPA: hypothetical protein [Caudoviricetes sp.]
MTKFIPAVPRYTAKPQDDYAYEKPSFSYYIDRDKTGCINGQPYHGVVVAKLSGGARDLANLWTKRDAFKIRELEDIASLLHVNSDLGPAYLEFEGKAYCSVDDKWDEDEGMRIARRKAWTQYYHALANYTYNYKKRIIALYEQIGKYDGFAVKRSHELDMENTEIQKMLEGMLETV